MDERTRRTVGLLLVVVSVALTVTVATDTAPPLLLVAAVATLVGGVFLAV